MPWTLFTILPAFGLAFAANAAPLGLVEAVRMAEEHSPKLEVARQNAAIGELEVKSAFARFFPTLDASARGGVQGQVTFPQTRMDPLFGQLGISLTETLYDNGESWARYDVARVSAEASRLNIQKERDQLALEVFRAYARLAQARELNSVRELKHGLLATQYKAVGNQFRQGLKTRQDYLRLQIQMQRSEIDGLAARAEIRQAEAELRRVLGVEDGSVPEFSGAGLSPNIDLQSVPKQELALKSTWEWRLAELQDRVQSLDERLARRRLWPQVNVSAGAAYNYQNTTGASDLTAISSQSALGWNALISLRYNFLDWGTQRRDAEIAERRRKIQASSRDEGMLGVRSRIEALPLELERLAAEYRLNRDLRAMDEQSYELMESEYRRGRIAYLELLTALNDLSDSRARAAQAGFALARQIAEYRYYEGTLYETLVQR